MTISRRLWHLGTYPRPPHSRKRAWSAVVATLFVALTAALCLHHALGGEHPRPRLGHSFDVDGGQAPPGDCLRPTDPNRALVSLIVRRLDREHLNASVDIGLCLPPGLKDQLVGDDGAVATFSGATSTIRRPYRHARIGVEWTTGLPDHSGPHTLPIVRETTLSDLNEQPAGAATFGRIISPVVNLGTVVVPLHAAPEQYPRDWYDLTGRLAVTVSRGIVGLPEPTPSKGRHSEPRPEWLPFSIILAADPSVASFSPLDASVSPCCARSRRLLVRFRRDWTTQAYVLAISCIPLLLAIILLVAMAARPNAEVPTPEGLTGYIAALLAVLPIRLVLVPAGVTDLTLVDYWLGVQMALLVWVAVRAERRGLTPTVRAEGARPHG